MADQDVVTKNSAGNVATVTINRPDNLNALNTPVYDSLYSKFKELADEDSLQVTILQTMGNDAFVAGADLKEIAGLSNQEFIKFQKNARRVHDYIASHRTMVIAAVDGIAYGGGFEIALAADMIVANPEAKFALPEVKLGLIPGGGATQRLPRLIGPNKAKELLATGEPISAREAHNLGIVNRIAQEGTPKEEAQELANVITSRAPKAVKEVKRVVNESFNNSLEAGLSLEQAITYELYDTEDAEEGIDAFQERREPEFEGR